MANKGDQWGPIVLDISFACDGCKKRVRARATVYPDVTYVTCQEKHHYHYDTPQQIKDFVTWISADFVDQSEKGILKGEKRELKDDSNRFKKYR